MRSRGCLFLLIAVVLSCGSEEGAFIGELTAPVVYGLDDRVEVFNHPDEELRRIAMRSVVAQVPSFLIEREPNGTYTLVYETLKDSKGLCDDERFAYQPTVAECSGVLIDDDLVLTAGHCMSDPMDCSTRLYVFDYYLDAPNTLPSITDEDVYSCAQIVLRVDPPQQELTPDFAVVQLDRPVVGLREPITIRPAPGPLVEQEPLTMIGFGSGLPAKIDSGAVVAEPRTAQLDFFVTNADAFLGHSGSPTLDSNDELAGFLIAGRDPDYIPSPEEGCNRVNTFDDEEAGEAIHYVAPVIAELCDGGWSSERLCGDTSCGGEPCGMPSPDGGGGVTVSAGRCDASRGTSGFGVVWIAVLLLLVARRLRQPAV